MTVEEKLAAPFSPDELEWRIGNQGVSKSKPWGMAFAYVTNRAIQNRLDEVFGAMNWQNEFREWKGKPNAQLAGISVWDSEKKQWVTKWDGAEDTDFEPTKGGLSDSMKRAAVEWGIGRYLYKLEATFVEVSMNRPRNKSGWHRSTVKDGQKSITYYWQNPELPAWALPKESK